MSFSVALPKNNKLDVKSHALIMKYTLGPILIGTPELIHAYMPIMWQKNNATACINKAKGQQLEI